jgi:hypothetical protein
MTICSYVGASEPTDELDIRLNRPGFNVLWYSDPAKTHFHPRQVHNICIGEFLCLPTKPIFRGLRLTPAQEEPLAFLGPKRTSTVQVVFGNENRPSQTLNGTSFEINVTSETLAEASFIFKQEYDAIFRAQCYAQGCMIGKTNDASFDGKLRFGPNASMTIRFINSDGKVTVTSVNDVQELDLSVPPQVGFLMVSGSLEVWGITSAVIEPSESPDFRPQTPDMLLWKNSPINTREARIRRLTLRPGDGYDILVKVAAGPGPDTTTFIATSNGIARVAINDVQALSGQLAYEAAQGPYRVIKQDVSGASQETDSPFLKDPKNWI